MYSAMQSSHPVTLSSDEGKIQENTKISMVKNKKQLWEKLGYMVRLTIYQDFFELMLNAKKIKAFLKKCLRGRTGRA